MDTIQRLIGSAWPILRAQSTSYCAYSGFSLEASPFLTPPLSVCCHAQRKDTSSPRSRIRLIQLESKVTLSHITRYENTSRIAPAYVMYQRCDVRSTFQPSGAQNRHAFPREGRCRVPKTELGAPAPVKRQELFIAECLNSRGKLCLVPPRKPTLPTSRWTWLKRRCLGSRPRNSAYRDDQFAAPPHT
jgi:hypothetical protein